MMLSQAPLGTDSRPIRQSLAPMFVLLGLAFLAGCTQNPYAATPGSPAWQAQMSPIGPAQAQLAEVTRRVQLLDDNNRQLTTQLAQSEQKSQVYRDELELIRNQLADVTRQFDVARTTASTAEQRVRGLQASAHLRGNASITPNTNLTALASRLNLPGITVLQDGDVIRIVLPADQLFRAGTAQLLPTASTLLDPVATQIRSVFPRHRVAIEGYTDNSPLYGGQVSSSHELASAQTSVVLSMLTTRSGLPSQQLFTVAQGANSPRQSNNTAAGRAANRRVELVIYPDTF